MKCSSICMRGRVFGKANLSHSRWISSWIFAWRSDGFMMSFEAGTGFHISQPLTRFNFSSCRAPLRLGRRALAVNVSLLKFLLEQFLDTSRSNSSTTASSVALRTSGVFVILIRLALMLELNVMLLTSSGVHTTRPWNHGCALPSGRTLRPTMVATAVLAVMACLPCPPRFLSSQANKSCSKATAMRGLPFMTMPLMRNFGNTSTICFWCSMKSGSRCASLASCSMTAPTSFAYCSADNSTSEVSRHPFSPGGDAVDPSMLRIKRLWRTILLKIFQPPLLVQECATPSSWFHSFPGQDQIGLSAKTPSGTS
mmetsp:Transcript_929/g.2283  ORF Transcript_929/g.2283 Transcript_929/m.2283 type:complete len:311 (-) Transcript_929:47-979(-)